MRHLIIDPINPLVRFPPQTLPKREREREMKERETRREKKRNEIPDFLTKLLSHQKSDNE